MDELFKDGQLTDVSRWAQIPIDQDIYHISNGVVGLFSKGKGVEKLLFAYKKGEVFPLLPRGTSKTSGRQFVYKALDSTSLHKISRQTFKRRVNQPQYASLFSDYLLHIIQHQVERIDNLQEEQIFQRLVARLVYLCSRFGHTSNDTVEIEVPMSHVSLAKSINSTRETVNRHMKQLENMGLASVNKQKIRITTLSGLHALQNEVNTHSN